MDTVKTGTVVKSLRVAGGSTFIVIRKPYNGIVLEALVFVGADGRVTMASYGNQKTQ